MTAAELIAELQKLPPDTKIVATVSDCCGCSFEKVSEIKMLHDGKALINATQEY